jgi:hypothetical protein
MSWNGLTEPFVCVVAWASKSTTSGATPLALLAFS